MRRILPAVDLPVPRWSTRLPAPGFAVLLGRRDVLKAFAALLGVLAAPVGRIERAWAARRGRYFTAHERATLGAYVDRIIPPDRDPGARALGVPQYIEGFLTALDGPIPRIYAGGPFSGRTPFPDNHRGVPGKRRPKNSFRRFLPLTYQQELQWRAELFGSAVVPEVAALDGQNGGTPLIGLRDLYRTSLEMIDTVAVENHGKPFVRLKTEQQDDVFTKMEGFTPDPRREATFNDIVIRHTLEGCFGPPEYGGNIGRRGWKMIGLEGDSQPLGYSIFDRRIDDYRERPGHPMTTVNPDEVDGARPLTGDGARMQASIVTLTAAFSGGNC